MKIQRKTKAKKSNSKHIYRSMHGKVDLEIENEGGGFNLLMIQNSKSIPNKVATFVSQKYTTLADKS